MRRRPALVLVLLWLPALTALASRSVSTFFPLEPVAANRVFADGRTQALTWDALGRLARVIEKNGAATNYLWRATYDGLGRRVRSEYWPRGTNSADAVTVKSWFDPEVEFLEVAVEVNGLRTWKVHGPDLSGSYGGLQGAGGLELTVCETNGAVVGVLNDFHGNTLATINPSPFTVNWVAARVNGYGPVSGYRAPVLGPNVGVAEVGVWRGERIEPTGFYWLGARHYDPVAGRFLSPDPLGHSASRGLYDFCNGDPVNHFDADGKLARSAIQGFEQFSSRASFMSVGPNWFDRQQQQASISSFWSGYRQTQANDFQMRYGAYFQSDTRSSMGQGLSSLLNMTPVVGALKMYTEFGFTGRDLLTGSRVGPMTWGTAAGISLNAVSGLGMMSGVMSQAARGAQFGNSYANWQSRNVLSWQTRPGQWYGPVSLKETTPIPLTFRGDPVAPKVAFSQGFSSKGTSKDLLAHALNSSDPPSAYIPTSTSPDVAKYFNARQVYVVRPVNGIDVNKTLGWESPHPNELEIAVPWRILPKDIRAVTLPEEGVSILNPGWKPHD